MYSGARLLSDLKTVRSILYSIRAMTGSQWSLIKIGVIEAYFLVPEMSLAKCFFYIH